MITYEALFIAPDGVTVIARDTENDGEPVSIKVDEPLQIALLESELARSVVTLDPVWVTANNWQVNA